MGSHEGATSVRCECSVPPDRRRRLVGSVVFCLRLRVTTLGGRGATDSVPREWRAIVPGEPRAVDDLELARRHEHVHRDLQEAARHGGQSLRRRHSRGCPPTWERHLLCDAVWPSGHVARREPPPSRTANSCAHHRRPSVRRAALNRPSPLDMARYAHGLSSPRQSSGCQRDRRAALPTCGPVPSPFAPCSPATGAVVDGRPGYGRALTMGLS